MDIIETESNVLVLNAQPEFSLQQVEDVTADYFVLVEEPANSQFGQSLAEYKVAGMSILDWVIRACEKKPVVLTISADDDILEVIKPHITGADYSVVLYANTPLLNKGHIKDLLSFVARKHMNACKLKKGYVFNNEYIMGADEIYSIDTYDFASNDFFEVKNSADLSFVQAALEKKVVAYHKKNGVYFESEAGLLVDASVEIGFSSVVQAGAKLINNSCVQNNVTIKTNAVVSNSKIGEDAVIGMGAIIENSVIKTGAVIGSGVHIKNSVIGGNVTVGDGTKILTSALKDECKIGDLVCINNARFGENVHIQSSSSVLGNKICTIISKNTMLGANSKVVDSKIAEQSVIEDNMVVINNKKVGS